MILLERRMMALIAALGIFTGGIAMSATSASASTGAPAPSTTSTTTSTATPTTTVVPAAQAAKLGAHLQPGEELVHTNACVKPQPGALPGAHPLVTTCAGAGHYTIEKTGAKGTTTSASPRTVGDDFCNYYSGQGWFGIEPGDASDGGTANDLWITTATANNITPLQLASGNGQNTQQWCFIPLHDGGWAIAAYYKNSNLGTYEYECIDITNGLGVNYAPGTRLQAYPCSWQGLGGEPANQDWQVCSRSNSLGDLSFEPNATAGVSRAWMDVWGGPGSQAFVAGHPLEIWGGNNADNQRFTLQVSPGSSDPNGVPYDPGC